MSTGIGNRQGDGERCTAVSDPSLPEPAAQDGVLRKAETGMDEEMLQTVLIPSPMAGAGAPVAGATGVEEKRRVVRHPEHESRLAETEAAQRSEDDRLLETIVADLTRLKRGSKSRHGGVP